MLQLSHIKKDYYLDKDKKPFTALNDISLSFPDRGFVSVLGPSGCGKTTLLNIIGGLDKYTAGDLVIDGKSTKDFKDSDWDAYRNERVGFVFQNYNLIPHMKVIANVEVSLVLNGVGPLERKKRALGALKSVGLEGEARKKPNQLSGGQMQRVALARALVNNPKIVLADEPTGALDSVTSVQVLELLKKVAKNRLVIMVTHNRELAERYSDRIIKMKDGKIIADSSSLVQERVSVTGKEKNKRTSMGFLTAIHSAVTNIMTKVGRTTLTAVACSFGIIGVAMVLAVNNGFSNYVDQVETSIATSVPITIAPISTTMTLDDGGKVLYPSDHNVVVYDSDAAYTSIHYNNITTEYVDQVLNPLEKDGLATVTYNYDNLKFNVITKDGGSDGYTYVKQWKRAGLSGSILSYVNIPSTVFHEMAGDENSILTNYNVISGHYPTNSHELVLIVDKYNRIDYSTLKYLGILNSDGTPNAELGQSKADDPFSYDDIVYSGVGDEKYKSYKAYSNSVFYRVKDGLSTSRTKKAWSITGVNWNYGTNQLEFKKTSVDSAGGELLKTIKGYSRVDDESGGETSPGYKSVYENEETYPSVDLKIVGVLRQKADAYLDTMPPSVGYLTSLKDEMLEDADTNFGRELSSVAAKNWWINRDEGDTSEDGAYLLENALNNAISNLSSATAEDAKGLTSNDISAISKAVHYAYPYVYDSYADYGAFGASYSDFLSSCESVLANFNQSKVQSFFDDVFAIAKDESLSQSAKASKLAEKFLDVFDDPGFYSDDVETENSYGIKIIDLIAYCNQYGLISSVNITPNSLADKTTIRARLDAWNEAHGDNTVSYDDYMSMFTDTLATFIRIISIVLLVFASISLVVSSVMTGIITYTSVIERTKEIGLLRACGARKRDVGRLFEAECFIIGLIAGLIGIVFTYLACIPIDAVIYNKYAIPNIALLNPWHAAVLLALSVLLAFLSGFVPARLAAKKDPVIALRSE
jgi:putative ABC transport system permease protein